MASTVAMLQAVVLAFVAGSTGLWYSRSGSPELVNEAILLHNKIQTLERKIASGAMSRSEKIAAMIRSLLHSSDRNGDGAIDGQERASAEASIAEHLSMELDDASGGMSASKVVILVGFMVALLAGGAVAYIAWRRRVMKAKNSKGVLKLTIVGCHELPNVDVKTKDAKDVTDAYVEATVGSQRKRTETVRNDLDPKFKSPPFSFYVDLNKADGQTAILRVSDGNNGLLSCGAEQAIGTACLDITEFAYAPNSKLERHLSLVLDEDVPNPEQKHPIIEVVGVYTPKTPTTLK